MQVFIKVKKHAFEGIVENVFWNDSQQVVVFSARASVEIMVNSVSARPIFMQFILSLKKMEKQRKCGRFLEQFCNWLLDYRLWIMQKESRRLFDSCLQPIKQSKVNGKNEINYKTHKLFKFIYCSMLSIVCVTAQLINERIMANVFSLKPALFAPATIYERKNWIIVNMFYNATPHTKHNYDWCVDNNYPFHIRYRLMTLNQILQYRFFL